MQYDLILDRIENDKAILKTGDNQTILWPKNKLPETVKEGDKLIFEINMDKETTDDRKEMAKNILNEILNTEDN